MSTAAAMAAVSAAAKQVGVSTSLLLAICGVESNFTHNINVNDGGSASYGICQTKLDTARMFNPRVTPGVLLTHRGSADYAAIYLRSLLARYHGDYLKAVSAYNAGRAIKGNQRYVNKVVARKTALEMN